MELSEPMVMGILNITPDSFFDGGKYQLQKDIEERCEEILSEGAKIIDLGAYSSRPGATHISEEEEVKRLTKALTWIRNKYPHAILSVDTFRASVSELVVNEFEVDIINDISGGTMDEHMFESIGQLGVPYILMHMQGTPQNMQMNPVYQNLIGDISLFFAEQLKKLRAFGAKDVILDLGFGFGKTLEHNYELLRELRQFELFELPMLVGISRKSMIYKLLGVDSQAALNGTTALNTIALLNGANILRVHDVKEAVECINLVRQLKKA
ncbi:dihydropteroate synthase [Carboxylicivirga litoralis]|uniref:dihydropteroate synthase n=1 Tax=Carboxylicivirga litoralis TaxID=2816963 RepID=UPI0021CB07A8|nr:dihydropteroate synthase [Carboxylicivirga sp. A043]